MRCKRQLRAIARAAPPTRLALGVIALSFIAGGVPVGSALALPLGQTQYLTPPTAGGQPYKFAGGPEGDLWFTERTANRIAQLDPATGAMSDYPTPTAGAHPEGIAVDGDGNIWFAETDVNRIGEINPLTHETRDFEAATPASGPSAITLGAEGNLWFTEGYVSKIGEINPVTGAVHDYATPTAAADPEGITAGPEGNIWFSETDVNKVGEINPSTDETADFATPGGSDHPAGMALGPEGNIWFADYGTGKIGFINPISHAETDYASPGAMNPTNITVGAEGNLWFADVNAGEIVEFSPLTHGFSDFPTAPDSFPVGIALGPDGNIWFGETGSSQVGEIGTNAPPASVLAPAVVGGGQAGIPQVCEGAGWSNFAGQQPLTSLYAYDGFEWLLNGGVIAGQRSASFTPAAGDAGASLSCRQTVTYPLTSVSERAASPPVTVISQNSGPPGPAGAKGVTGAKGATGRVELVKCKSTTTGTGTHVKVVQRCTAETVSSAASITSTGASVSARLSRGKTLFATGLLIGTRRRSQLLLDPRRTIPKGRYTLTLTNGREHERETITIY